MECPDNSIIKKTDTQGCLTVSFENKNSIKASVTEVGNNAVISMDRIGGNLKKLVVMGTKEEESIG